MHPARNLWPDLDVLHTSGHLVLPAFPLCIGRHLETGQFLARLFCGRREWRTAMKNARPRGRAFLVRNAPRLQAVARTSRRRALCWKNRAWLITAETFAGWNGFAIRKAGSGRSPVRKRSG